MTFDVYGSVLPQVEESVTEGLRDLFSSARGAAVVQGATRTTPSVEGIAAVLPLHGVEVRGIEPLASTVRLLRSTN